MTFYTGPTGPAIVMKTVLKLACLFVLFSTLTGGWTGFRASVTMVGLGAGGAAAMAAAGAIAPRDK